MFKVSNFDFTFACLLFNIYGHLAQKNVLHSKKHCLKFFLLFFFFLWRIIIISKYTIRQDLLNHILNVKNSINVPAHIQRNAKISLEKQKTQVFYSRILIIIFCEKKNRRQSFYHEINMHECLNAAL